MTDATTFVENFLAHDYDPVKAHEYYMKNRQLKGRKAADAEFEKMNVADAQKKLNRDLKTSPKIKPTRRISVAEQKLIRARALASRIQDPAVRKRLMAKVVAAEHKLMAIQKKHGVPAKTSHKTKPKVLAPSQAGYPGKPHKLGTRFQEDESPMKSPGGAKLTAYSGDGLGRAEYADGSVYDGAKGWVKPPKKKTATGLRRAPIRATKD